MKAKTTEPVEKTTEQVEAELARTKKRSKLEVEAIDAAAGAAAGAAVGILGGPIGMAAGAVLGAVAGAALGHQSSTQEHEKNIHDEWMGDEAERRREERNSGIPPMLDEDDEV